MDTFKWKENCFLCGKVALNDPKHPDRGKIVEARTLELKDNIISLCKQRNDEWAEAIEHRISNCIDFVASEAVYHPRCYQKLHWYVLVLVLFYFSILTVNWLFERIIN